MTARPLSLRSRNTALSTIPSIDSRADTGSNLNLSRERTSLYCATVGFSDITSANVVGYQNKDVRQYLSQQVCTFDQIGAENGSLNIQNLIPVDANGDEVSGEVTVQFISAFGVLQNSYTYFEEEGYDEGYVAGWYDDDGELAVYTFAAAEAFQIYSGVAVNFIYSGEVNMAETDVPFRQYLSVQANIRPSAVNIQSIIPVDDNEEVISGDVTVQFISSFGVLQNSYTYFEEDGYDEGYAAGWYDDDGELVEYTLTAGEGFKLYAGTAGYLRFPEL